MTGHLPIGTDSGPRVGADPAQARGAAPVSQSAGAGPAVSLAELVCQLSHLTARAYAQTKHHWDPTTGPQQSDPYEPADVYVRLAAVAAELRSALDALDGLRSLIRPAPGHAVTVPPVSVSRESNDAGARVGAGAKPRGVPREGLASGVGMSDASPLGEFAAGAAPMGASFALPVAPRLVMPGSDAVRAGINEALARRSR